MPELEKIRHSASHVLAQAVLSLFPKTKLGIGPAIENGFYYDFDLETPITESDLKSIEEKMLQIISEKQTFKTYNLNKKESIKKLKESNQTLKLELIKDLNLKEYSFFENGPFTDLCKGPHIEHTGEIKAIKLLKVSGAYWKGSEKNKMLQRIYGTAFKTPKDLRTYLNNLKEAEKRDHRLLGKKLELFSINEDIGSGLILWHPKGAKLRDIIETYWKNIHQQAAYDLICTPHIGKSKLWKTSGHLDFYQENMFSKIQIENQDYYIKPMNCPFHIEIYKAKHHSYKQLPVRYAELGTVYRYERSGVLHGLMRVRGFTQDDAHIICTKDQIKDEIEKSVQLGLNVLKTFGFSKFKCFISTKPKEKSVGSRKNWDEAEEALIEAAKNCGLDYEIDEGGGAFYGPKIDIKIEDALNRLWQCSTFQFDFNLPEKFNLYFINQKGEKEEPFMIHRALFGSLERFIGILIEHYNGKFPLWLAPIQISLLSVNQSVSKYTQEIAEKLRSENLRVKCDVSDENISGKIKKGLEERIPLLGIIGNRESEANTITIRENNNQKTYTIKELINKLKQK